MKPPRGLSESEAAAWARLAATVTRIGPPLPRTLDHVPDGPGSVPSPTPPTPLHPVKAVARSPRPLHYAPPRPPAPGFPSHAGEKPSGLDSHWERRLRAGSLSPDFTLDLHEHSLEAAYQRLLGGLDIARETGARVVLVIAGRERHAPAADRAHHRGAIRAKLLDWLAASRHSEAIAAIRKAHRRHSGEGAVYVILRKPARS